MIKSSVFIGGAFANSKTSDELEVIKNARFPRVHRFETAYVRHI